MKIPSIPTCVLVALLCVASSQADVKLPAIISNGMVLEKAAKVPLWGTADPAEEVTVTFNKQTVRTKADASGKWKTVLNLKKSAPGPFEMQIRGKNSLTISDVLVGEVWIASGQSNMAMQVKNTKGAEEEIAASANPMIRQFVVKRLTSPVPLEDTEGSWVSASPGTTGEFTAVGYYFAKKLNKELRVPVGLVHSSWGGTPSEAWTSMEAIDSVPGLKAAREKLWPALVAHPEYVKNRQAYVEAMGKWLKDHKREDKPGADNPAYSGENVSTKGWIPVQIPGKVAAAGLPETGIVWLRREIDVPPQTGASLPLILPIDGYDTVFWNGTLLAQTTYDRYGGPGSVRRYGKYAVPPKLVKEGRNVIAIRLFQPAGPTVFTDTPKVGPLTLDGTWMAKVESPFPPLAKAAAAAPQAPAVLPDPSQTASALFNGMIQPILPYAASGVIWYQGESNAGRAFQYRSSFPLMIKDWRKQWGRNDLPFYFCQLANYMAKKPGPGDSGWAELREAQSLTLSLPNTGQAILIDIGESGDIHPRNKKDAGERLALIALAKDYGQSVTYSGPVYNSMRIEGTKIRIKFRHTDGGLTARSLPETYEVNSGRNETAPLIRNSPGSPLEGFAICGADRKWFWAEAHIDGKDVVVSSNQVPSPIAVRYAWADNPTCNLANGKGLPACPFRTDDFPILTQDGKY